MYGFRGYESSDILKTSDGTPIANMQVTHEGITLTFLDSINNLQPDTVSGTIKAYAYMYTDMGSSDTVDKTVSFLPDNNSDSETSSVGNVDVTINKAVVGNGSTIIDTSKPFVTKSAGSNKDNVETWNVQISVTTLKEATFTDYPGNGLTIDADSLKFDVVGSANSESGLVAGKSYTLSDLIDKGIVTSDSGVQDK